jgi:spore coat polysaccharide biosynthesis protein SpsF
VIATTVNDTDNQIVNLCKKLDTLYYRGSEEDVLGRYYEAAVEYGGDVIIRITSDCPVIDPEVVDYLISSFTNNIEKYDYVSNTLERSYPRGMDVEIVSFKALKEAHFNAHDPFDRQHLTPFIKKRPQQFQLYNILYKADMSRFRLTIDTSEDMELISKIFESLYYQNTFFSLNDIFSLMDRKPEWVAINAHIEQKIMDEY